MASSIISVQPPAKMQVGAPIYPPPIIEISVPSGSSRNYFANISLCDHDGKVVDGGVSGTKSVGGFAKASADASGTSECYVFGFPDLEITTQGQSTLRVDIYDLDDGASLLWQLSTRFIKVSGNTVSRAMASPEERCAIELAKQIGALPLDFNVV